MKIGAYQFAITNQICQNLAVMKKAILQASQRNVRLLVFPECALTGYPPRDMPSSSAVRCGERADACTALQSLTDECGMTVIVGSITGGHDGCHNSAIVFSPRQPQQFYHKRALWGWDQDNFTPGMEDGIFDIEGITIGVRICYEIRFPEFFRELYRARTDLNIVLFYDVSDRDDMDRYELITSHIRTRAVENVTFTLSVNTISPYQTAPTALYDRSGRTLSELKRQEEMLLVYDLEKTPSDFGERGREQISDRLLMRYPV